MSSGKASALALFGAVLLISMKAPPRLPARPPVHTTDAQIAEGFQAANQTLSDLALAEAPRLGTTEVRRYATEISRERRQVNRKLNELVHRTRMQPEPNPLSLELKALESHAEETLAELSVSRNERGVGPNIDREFLDTQITLRRRALALLDRQWIPLARDPRLRQLLQAARPDFQAELARTVALRDRMLADRREEPQD